MNNNRKPNNSKMRNNQWVYALPW